MRVCVSQAVAVPITLEGVWGDSNDPRLRLIKDPRGLEAPSGPELVSTVKVGEVPGLWGFGGTAQSQAFQESNAVL